MKKLDRKIKPTPKKLIPGKNSNKISDKKRPNIKWAFGNILIFS